MIILALAQAIRGNKTYNMMQDPKVYIYRKVNLNSCPQVPLLFCFFFFFGFAVWLVGPQFPDQGLNPSHSSESLKC